MQFYLISECKKCRTYYAGVIAELGYDYFCWAHQIAAVAAFPDIFLHRFKKFVTLIAYTAADGNILRLKCVDKVYYALGNISYILIHNLFCGGIAAICAVESYFAGSPASVCRNLLCKCGVGVFISRALCVANECGRRGICLPAALSAAGALLSVHGYHGMTQFSGDAVESFC